MNTSEQQYHSLPVKDILELLQTDPKQGLDADESLNRLHRFGENRLAVKQATPPWLRFLLQCHQPLIYILIGSSIITGILGQWVDCGVIFGVVLVNAVIGYIQESKAEHALDALAETMVAEATVIRQGEKLRIPATGLVVGDIVLLQSGDKVPADLRLMQAKTLQVDESALTGESMGVEKSILIVDPLTMLAERTNMVYATSAVTSGQGTGIVVATGNATEVGRISTLIASARELATPLTRKIDHFSSLLLYVILFLSVVTIVVGLLRGQTMFDMFMAAVALAVGAIPEGLPAAVTITLAIGVSRMARRKAIIRKLPAVETLGSASVICSDKTGTLTENQMTVQAVIAGSIHYEVSGTGYAPQGQIVSQQGAEEFSSTLNKCLQAGLLCNDSELLEVDGSWQVQGDPTEGALLTVAAKGGLNRQEQLARFSRLDTIPFESQHQYMATMHDQGDGRPHLVYVKGAIEQVVARCSFMLDANGSPVLLDPEQISIDVERLAARGLRVLAFAEKEISNKVDIEHDDVATDLILIGLQGMIDPPRPEAVKAVRTCLHAGIRVKMITGDHPLTAAAIAGQIGLDFGADKGDEPIVYTGQQLEQLSDDELVDVVRRVNVFARATPEQKIRLVRALQQDGEVVAMTGDGVNDAPALKQADIGVAMGITGTDVSREAADMVLTDDNFSSIEAAIEEGRGVFDNLTKFIVWTLPTNLGEGLVILVAVFFGTTLPILPVQILWINMTTAGILGLMLAFEAKEPGIMSRLPRDPKIPILTNTLIARILLVGTLLLIGAFGLFQWELALGASIEQARTVAVNVFIVMELFYLFNCRSLHLSVFQLGFFSNLWVVSGVVVMLLLQVVYTYLPVMNKLFQSEPISVNAWCRIGAAGLAGYFIVELEKKLRLFAGRDGRL